MKSVSAKLLQKLAFVFKKELYLILSYLNVGQLI